MNEYLVGIKIGVKEDSPEEDHTVTEVFIDADNKSEAILDANKKLREKGFFVFGTSYCETL